MSDKFCDNGHDEVTPECLPCQSACDHADVDDFTCLDCSKDLTEEIAARAYDRYKDKMKYGE